MKILFTTFLCIFAFTYLYAAQPATLGKLLSRKYPSLKNDTETLILIYFKDKGNSQKFRLEKAQSFISNKSIKRRLKVRTEENIIDEKDYPLEKSYVQAISNLVIRTRHELKWFNAVSASATKSQINKLMKLPFVTEIELVGRWRKNQIEEVELPTKESESIPKTNDITALNYGTSYTQVNQIKVPAVHNLGIYGQGVVVGVFDNGFRLPNHEAFSTMSIIATYDFVDHKVSVVPNNTSTSFGSHGVNTLSTIGGYKSGQLIGPAFKSSFILARTENDSSETPIEEDIWAKAIEWADSIGVDVTSTSLGYITYDSPYPSWTWQDMDGNTTLITRAADRAASLGIVVVNSAGNEGYNASHNTLVAPSDGDSVIAVGAVNSSGSRVSFSSVGPTTDVPPRIKPDVMAMGTSVWVASATNPTGYNYTQGTSFSCPLAAGVATLILCANPSLTPMQVAEAMRQTASNASSPNNLVGWGILNADSAIKYYGKLPFAHISGTTFHDYNGNGTKNSGEPGISGIKVLLSGSSIDSTVTDLQGDYTFDSLSIGSYTISEVVPSGWVQVYPQIGIHTVFIDSVNSNITGKDFGNFQTGSIHGMKFEDINGNGIKDELDLPLAGWKIILSGDSSMVIFTDMFGNFSFTGLLGGNYTLGESLQSGWAQSKPLGTYSVRITSGLDTSGFDFGNYKYGVIDGLIFHDLNQSCTKDEDEEFLSDWIIKLNGPISTTTTTDTNGIYSFSNLVPGVYSISESIKTDWLQTCPTNNSNYNVIIISGTDTSGFNFGNLYTPDTSCQVAAGWNLLSLPVYVTDNKTTTLYPSAISSAFKYENGYKIIDTIPNGIGYWLKFDNEQDIPIYGSARNNDTLYVTSGWHMIGTLSSSVGNIELIPENTITSPFFQYDGGYSIATTLEPHKGYWVKTKTGKIILSVFSSAKSSYQIQSINSLTDELNSITLRDVMDYYQTLYFGNIEEINNNLDVFELPPTPPTGSLDVRFSTGKMVAQLSHNDEAVINIDGGTYPLSISWNIKEREEQFILYEMVNDMPVQNWDMQKINSIKINNPNVSSVHIKNKKTLSSEYQTPNIFHLETNYPNPFNPTTSINFYLPEDQKVTLKIFNILGKELFTLIDDKQYIKGRYEVNVNVNQLASGIYIYRIQTEKYSALKKMTLIK